MRCCPSAAQKLGPRLRGDDELSNAVIPANAGIQPLSLGAPCTAALRPRRRWAPAFAGVTINGKGKGKSKSKSKIKIKSKIKMGPRPRPRLRGGDVLSRG